MIIDGNEVIKLDRVPGSDYRKYEVRRGSYVAGILEQFDSMNIRAYGRAYGLQTMKYLGTFRTVKAAATAVANVD